MAIELKILCPSRGDRYPAVSMRYMVTSFFDVDARNGGLGGLIFSERKLAEPYVKDLDEHEKNAVQIWSRESDISKWGFFAAVDGGAAVGRAAVATPDWSPLLSRGRKDVAILADIRVDPDHRGRGVGRCLLSRCAEWAKGQEYLILAIETQNVNVPACRLYAAAGAELAAIDRFGYAGCPEVAHEAMLIWHLEL